MGNGEFPKPQSAREGEGSHGKAGRLRALPPSEQNGSRAQPRAKEKEGKKEGRERNNTAGRGAAAAVAASESSKGP